MAGHEQRRSQKSGDRGLASRPRTRRQTEGLLIVEHDRLPRARGRSQKVDDAVKLYRDLCSTGRTDDTGYVERLMLLNAKLMGMSPQDQARYYAAIQEVRGGATASPTPTRASHVTTPTTSHPTTTGRHGPAHGAASHGRLWASHSRGRAIGHGPARSFNLAPPRQPHGQPQCSGHRREPDMGSSRQDATTRNVRASRHRDDQLRARVGREGRATRQAIMSLRIATVGLARRLSELEKASPNPRAGKKSTVRPARTAQASRARIGHKRKKG